MTSEIDNKITTLESLYSEQEYTLLELNKVISRQDLEIIRLSEEMRWLKQQLITLKEQLPVDQNNPVDETPPHY